MGLKLGRLRRQEKEPDTSNPSWWLHEDEEFEEFTPRKELPSGPADRGLHRGQELPMTLEYREARMLYRSIQAQRKKKERSKSKSTFVPEPGHRDAAQYAIDQYQALEDKLMQFIESFP